MTILIALVAVAVLGLIATCVYSAFEPSTDPRTARARELLRRWWGSNPWRNL